MVIVTTLLLFVCAALLAGFIFWKDEAQAYKERNQKAQLKIVELERQLGDTKAPPGSISFDDLLMELDHEQG